MRTKILATLAICTGALAACSVQEADMTQSQVANDGILNIKFSETADYVSQIKASYKIDGNVIEQKCLTNVKHDTYSTRSLAWNNCIKPIMGKNQFGQDVMLNKEDMAKQVWMINLNKKYEIGNGGLKIRQLRKHGSSRPGWEYLQTVKDAKGNLMLSLNEPQMILDESNAGNLTSGLKFFDVFDVAVQLPDNSRVLRDTILTRGYSPRSFAYCMTSPEQTSNSLGASLADLGDLTNQTLARQCANITLQAVEAKYKNEFYR